MEHGHHHEHPEDHHGEHAHHDMNHHNHASPAHSRYNRELFKVLMFFIRFLASKVLRIKKFPLTALIAQNYKPKAEIWLPLFYPLCRHNLLLSLDNVEIE